MPRAPKDCGHPGCPNTVTARTYCDEHQRERRRNAKPSPTSLQRRPNRVRKERAAAVAAWVAVHGWVCPGWRRPPHESHDLTAAHTTAVVHGGAHSQLLVLCRPCNSRQRTTPTP